MAAAGTDHPVDANAPAAVDGYGIGAAADATAKRRPSTSQAIGAKRQLQLRRAYAACGPMQRQLLP